MRACVPGMVSACVCVTVCVACRGDGVTRSASVYMTRMIRTLRVFKPESSYRDRDPHCHGLHVTVRATVPVRGTVHASCRQCHGPAGASESPTVAWERRSARDSNEKRPAKTDRERGTRESERPYGLRNLEQPEAGQPVAGNGWQPSRLRSPGSVQVPVCRAGAAASESCPKLGISSS